MDFTCYPAGDKAVLVEFEQIISEEINQCVLALAHHLESHQIPGIEELVPAYASLMVYYDPMKISYDDLVQTVYHMNNNPNMYNKNVSNIHEIPVLYGGKWGPDLKSISEWHGLSEREVIHIHSQTLYRVYMLGFVPGFPYLGGLDSRLHTPRLETPRLKIPAGSVGIAGQQTGIYPLTTPGGWRIIGHTPISLFNPRSKDRPTFIAAGDYIRFIPIAGERYKELIESLASINE